MLQEKIPAQSIERRISNSDFVEKYVSEHKEALEKLRARAQAVDFDGSWVIIGDEKYPQKRQQYATTSFPEEQMSPRIILYPAGDEDIQKAMHLCREFGMAIAVRTGGHQYCGFSSTSPVNMQIDLSKGKNNAFTQYSYDRERNVLQCGVDHALGAWAELNKNNGIYLPMGVCANVHLGGHVHTGGWGMVARSHGLLADHVLAFNIILPSGNKERIVRPEKDKTTQHNDDLYYAVLGGGKGGDFGIVTQWEFSPLRDENYPNSACYKFVWLWGKKKMEKAVGKMAELAKLCEEGKIPSDYEFMLNITSVGPPSKLSDPVIDGLREQGLAGDGNIDLLSNPVKDELREMGYIVKDDVSGIEGIAGKEIFPAAIVMWMCFTNKKGQSEQFDDQWFESFTKPDVCGKPLLHYRYKKTPVSKGLAEDFIMKQHREMPYPFVKRFRVTMDIPEDFSKTYTERISEILNYKALISEGQHFVSQQQIYSGGAIAENGKAEITSYSWREQALAMSLDAFYSVGWPYDQTPRKKAEQWQNDNDKAFIEQQGFANSDMRMFAYTFGDHVLENVWPYYYDSKEKYERLRRIKETVDPDGLLSADKFSLRPL